MTAFGATLYDVGVVHTAPPPGADLSSQATMFGYAAPAKTAASQPPPSSGVVASPVVAINAAPAPQPAQQRPNPKQTMIGMSGGGALPPAPTASPVLPPAPQPSPFAVPNKNSTMLGVALPGIAPTRASAAAEPPRTKGPNSTMLGVALPGIAPAHSSQPAVAQPAPQAAQPRPRVGGRTMPLIVPAPAPLVDDEPAFGPAPHLARGGVPVAYVAGGVGALVIVFGLAVALLWKGQSLIVVPRLDSQGRDQLHLTCDSCPDGTVVAQGGVTSAFQKKEADLTLAAPLQVGDNPLTIHLGRPGWGRSEDVSVVVPVPFRIKSDLSALLGPHPAILVRVTAVPGSVVQVDGKPVTLDAKGEGTYSLDQSAQTMGWADDLRHIDQSIPYSITTPASGAVPGAERHDKLAVNTGIATLHMDGPGQTAVIDTPTFRLVGHTVKGGTVTVNGQPVPVEPDGSFARAIDVPVLGDAQIDVRADAPQFASRSVRFTVKRVARLADEAKARERAAWIAYDGMMADTAGSVGKDTVVEGDVVEGKAVGNQVVALIDDARGCDRASRGACIVRVVYTGDDTAMLTTTGTHVRVYGKVTGQLPSLGGRVTKGPVPIVQADFAVRGKH